VDYEQGLVRADYAAVGKMNQSHSDWGHACMLDQILLAELKRATANNWRLRELNISLPRVPEVKIAPQMPENIFVDTKIHRVGGEVI
jgi:hypothetical protein